MREWQDVVIEELCSEITDCVNKTAPSVDYVTPYKMIRTTNIKQGRINLDEVRYVTEETYKTWIRRGAPQLEDIILTREAPVGEVGMIRTSEKVFLGQRTMMYRADRTKADPYFLYYAFQTEAVQEQIHSAGMGSVVEHVRVPDAKKFKINTPPLPEQKAIASVLSSLDDKIDLLHRQNKTLEAMAETLFRQWFIEDAEGKTELITLGEMIEIHDSKRIPLSKLERDKKKNGSIMYPYYGAAKIMDYVDDYIFDGDYLLLGEDGTVQDENGYPILQRANGKFWVNNHSHVLSAKAPYNNFFLWCLLSKTNIEKAVTGAVQPKINQENLRKLDFVKFDESKVLDFNDITSSMLNKLNTNNLQIQTIEKLRDTLLPKLMSGEVRVQYQTEQIA